MTARLPIPGGDDGNWGDILNEFLEVSLNSDGTLTSSAVQAAGAIVQAKVGAANGVAGLNGGAQVPAGQLGSGTASSSNFLRGDGIWAVPVGSAVTNVFGRVGAVTAQSGDYTAADVTYAADTSSASVQTFTGNVSAPAIIAAGLTGAAAASRYVGATTSGAPAAGTFSTGDFIVDQTGGMWICTAPGTPGTWKKASVSLDSTASDIQPLGTQAAGAVGKAADAGHVHATTGVALLAGATFSGGVNPAVVALTYGSTITVNAAGGNDFRVTLTGTGATIGAPSNPTDGQRITFMLTQDSTGSRTVVWAAAYNFGTAGMPTLSTAANLTDVIGFVYNQAIGQWLAAGAALGF